MNVGPGQYRKSYFPLITTKYFNKVYILQVWIQYIGRNIIQNIYFLGEMKILFFNVKNDFYSICSTGLLILTYENKFFFISKINISKYLKVINIQTHLCTFFRLHICEVRRLHIFCPNFVIFAINFLFCWVPVVNKSLR